MGGRSKVTGIREYHEGNLCVDGIAFYLDCSGSLVYLHI